MKRRLRDYRRELGKTANIETDGGIMGRSGKVVLTAIAMYFFTHNFVIF